MSSTNPNAQPATGPVPCGKRIRPQFVGMGIGAIVGAGVFGVIGQGSVLFILAGGFGGAMFGGLAAGTRTMNAWLIIGTIPGFVLAQPHMQMKGQVPLAALTKLAIGMGIGLAVGIIMEVIYDRQRLLDESATQADDENSGR